MSSLYLLSVLRSTVPYYHTKVIDDIIAHLENKDYVLARQVMIERAEEIKGTLFQRPIEKYLGGIL